MARTDELRLIARVARMYHLDGMKQQDIARRLHISQAGISRMLKRGADEGIVRIVIDAPSGTFLDLEERLAARFGLTDMVIADCREDDEWQVTARIGEAAAQYVQATLQPGEVVGISSWSESLVKMVDNFDPQKKVHATRVVQILGGMGKPSVQAHATALTTRLACLTQADPMLLATQGIAGSVEARQILVSDPYVQSTLDEFGHVTTALVGVGAVEPSKLLADSGNVFTTTELDDLAAQEAAGDICLHFFKEDGRAVHSPVEGRVIGVTFDQLRAIPRVVAVAGGTRKRHALLGALRTGLLDVLVTDQFTACWLEAETTTPPD